MMRGLDWQALPVVVDLLGIADIDLLVAQLLVLRDNLERTDGQ